MDSSDHENDLNHRKLELYNALAQLAEKYGIGGRTSTVAKLLTSTQCERRIAYSLVNISMKSNQRFDGIYREVSTFATVKILDYLKARLDGDGYNVALATETKDVAGRYDITLVAGDPCVVKVSNEPIVRIEIKGLTTGLPLEQVGERFIWNNSPLIVVRILLGQVFLVRPSDLQGLVGFSLSNNLAKARRILDEAHYTVPGACYGCADTGCSYNERRGLELRPLISPVKVGEDLKLALMNLPKCAESTASYVLNELVARGYNPLAPSARTADSQDSPMENRGHGPKLPSPRLHVSTLPWQESSGRATNSQKDESA